jgi:hypothetical protein
MPSDLGQSETSMLADDYVKLLEERDSLRRLAAAWQARFEEMEREVERLNELLLRGQSGG